MTQPEISPPPRTPGGRGEVAPALAPLPAGVPGLRVHLVLCFVQATFGIFHVVGKAVLAEMEPLALAGIRALVAAPVLMLLAWRRDHLLPRPRDLPMLALLGALGVFANQVLFVTGLRHTTAINASILMVSLPALTAAVAAVLGIERVGRGRLFGILLSMTGALFLLEPWRSTLFGGTTLGNGLILVNCLCYAIFLVLQRPVLRRLPWRTVIAWAFLFGSLGVLAIAAPDLAALPRANLSASTWLGAAYIALIPTALAYALSTWAIRRSSPALVAAYSTLQPLVSALLAASFLGERFGWVQGAGFALILLGLWRVSVRA